MSDPFVGSLTFVRVYSGKLESGSYLVNTVKDQRERIGRILLMHANNREEIKEAYAGDIVALVGLKDTTTGDTLSDPAARDRARADGVPGAGHRGRGRAQTKADQEKMGVALARWRRRTRRSASAPTRRSGQTVIKGMGELHLEIIVDRMKREYKVEANVGAPQVAYRETITRRADVDYTHKKQTGGSGQFARVKLTFQPGEKGSGIKFENKVVGGSVPKEYIPGVAEGRRLGLADRRHRGLPVGRRGDPAGRRRLPRGRQLGARVRDRDPGGVQGGRGQGRPAAARAGDARRGGDARGVHGRHHRRPEQPARADHRHGAARQRPGGQRHGAARHHVRLRQHAALARQGRAQFTMHFDHYEPVPQMVAEEIRAKYA